MKNINEQIEKLQAELDELKAIANKPKEMIERVANGEWYYFISGLFEVQTAVEADYGIDDERYNIGNYYTDKAIAERVAKYYRDNNMFIRKGIEIADGYDFTFDTNNYSVVVADCDYLVLNSEYTKITGLIYMTKQNAENFKEWLDIHMPLS